MREVYLGRCPTAPRHQSHHVETDRGGEFVVLARRLHGRVGQSLPNVRPLPVDGERDVRTIVVHPVIADDVLEANRERGRVERHVGEGTHVLRAEVLAEMQAEARIPRRPGRVLEQPRERGAWDEAVRIGEGRPIESHRSQDRLGPASSGDDRLDQARRRRHGDHRSRGHASRSPLWLRHRVSSDCHAMSRQRALRAIASRRWRTRQNGRRVHCARSR